MTPSRIVCAVDFSAGSRVALEEAAELAIRTRATLVIAHVEEPPLWANENYLHLPGDVREEVRIHAETELAKWVADARGLGVAEVGSKLESGVVWEAIVRLARVDPSIGWIVVGSRGRTGIKRILLGSVAEQVVRHAPCSVLVARAREPS